MAYNDFTVESNLLLLCGIDDLFCGVETKELMNIKLRMEEIRKAFLIHYSIFLSSHYNTLSEG